MAERATPGGYGRSDGSFAQTLVLSLAPTPPITEDTDAAAVDLADRGVARLALVVSAITGLSPTLDVTVEESPDGETWEGKGSYDQVTEPGSQRKIFTGCDRYLRATFDVEGDELGDVTKTPGARQTITASVDSDADHDVVVTVMATGGRGVGTFKVSKDGGDTFGSTVPIPSDGVYVVPSTGGLTLTFANATYFAGDSYSFHVAASVLGAVTKTPGARQTITPSGDDDADESVVVEITTTGGRNAGAARYSLDGGSTWSSPSTIPSNGVKTVPGTSSLLIVTFANATYYVGDQYAFTVAKTVLSSVTKSNGAGPNVTPTGTPVANYNVAITITKTGGRNAGKFIVSTDGGTSYSGVTLIPSNGVYVLGSTGLTLTFDAASFTEGDTFSFTATAPVFSAITTTPATPQNLPPTGTPAANYNVVVEIMTTGGRNAGAFKVSTDGGSTFGGNVTIPSNGVYLIPSTGITVTFANAVYTLGDSYSFTATAPVFGSVTTTPVEGPDVTPSLRPSVAGDVVVEIVTSGARGTATFYVSLDGGDTFGEAITIPSGGTYAIPDTGITLTFASGAYVAGDRYGFESAPLAFTLGLSGEAV